MGIHDSGYKKTTLLLDVVVAAAAAFENLPDAVAEVPFYFKDQAADPRILIICMVAEDLLGEGIKTGGGLSAADRAEDGPSILICSPLHTSNLLDIA